ncbi:MAG: electron transport complex subunit RsxA [Candidatus Contubernalis sp.]|nr:electron transport complex subunit RsxA [Candidatus Contubernalis sp.]
MGELIAIFLGAILINNFVLTRFLGICPFLGVSKKIETSVGMGAAVIFVMAMAATFTWLVEQFILVPLSLEYLRTIAFILIIASLVQFVEMVIQKVSPALYEGLGVFLPLITTNCAVLGVAILNIQEKFNLIESIVHAVGAAAGFTLALVILAGIRERLELATMSKLFKGASVALITAGILSIAFQGFQGMM